MSNRVTREEVDSLGWNTPETEAVHARALHDQLNMLCRIGLEIRDLLLNKSDSESHNLRVHYLLAQKAALTASANRDAIHGDWLIEYNNVHWDLDRQIEELLGMGDGQIR